jgi:ubiquinone/menaquinone biosynthesis C-methylase UbiE
MRLEYLFLRLRNTLGIPFKPENELSKLDISRGQTVLDFGCGIGSFTPPVAQLVGAEGKVFALDKEPYALETVRKAAQKKGLTKIEAILSECDTLLPAHSVDLILFYGVLPDIEDPAAVLKELHRMLKPGGTLSTRSCFRITREGVMRIINATGLFTLRSEKGRILSFLPV